ncbi:MAG: hypothetical protein OXG91_09810 [bacterium]|nr:hypothetical protein [bacterium]
MPAREREPDNVHRARTYREEAALRRPGPNRDALNRLADALEATDDIDRVPNRVLSAGLQALGSDDYLDPDYPLYQTETPKLDNIRRARSYRKEAALRRPGPNRDALNRLADALEATDDIDRVPNRVLSAGLQALGSDDYLDPDYPLYQTETPKLDNIRRARSYRKEAALRRPGPNRDALNRLADALEATDDIDRVPNRVLSAGLQALGSDDYLLTGDTPPPGELEPTEHDPSHRDGSSDQPDAREADRKELPPILRRSAADRAPGPNRDALVRLADELETAGDVTLVRSATLRDGLRALGSFGDAAEA